MCANSKVREMPDRNESFVHTVVTESDRLSYPDSTLNESVSLQVCREESKLRRGRFLSYEPDSEDREHPFISSMRPTESFRAEFVPVPPPFRGNMEARVVLRDLKRLRRIAMLIDLKSR